MNIQNLATSIDDEPSQRVSDERIEEKNVSIPKTRYDVIKEKAMCVREFVVGKSPFPATCSIV